MGLQAEEPERKHEREPDRDPEERPTDRHGEADRREHGGDGPEHYAERDPEPAVLAEEPGGARAWSGSTSYTGTFYLSRGQ